jgi:hypothetical protein
MHRRQERGVIGARFYDICTLQISAVCYTPPSFIKRRGTSDTTSAISAVYNLPESPEAMVRPTR